MSISNSYPQQRATLNLDFANSGKLDSRLSYSRSSGGTYMSSEKSLNSENLLLQSQAFDTTWDQVGLSSRSGGNADPAGGTTAHRFIEDSSSATHRVYQTVSSTGKTSLTVYAKQAVGTRYLALKVSTGAGGPYDWVVATYDLAGGTPAMTTGTGATSIVKTSSQTLSGGGFYKCTLTVESSGGGVNVSMASVTTPSPANYGHIGYTGDGASAIDVAFSSLNSTGATDYNATTTQISRSYSQLLKTASADEPRFEFATDGQSVGTAKGLLIEAQSSNLFARSSGFDYTAAWTKTNVTATAEAISPDGTLNAFAIRENTSASTFKRIHQAATVAAGSVAVSVYAKLLGNERRLVIREDSTTGDNAVFDLSSGTVAATNVGGAGTIESVGNGWYRCTLITSPSGSPGYQFGFWLATATGTTTESYTGDGFSGLLLYGAMCENASASSSYLESLGSTTTRASDSCSVALSDVGITSGQDLTAVVEGVTAEIAGASLIGFDDGSSSNYARITSPSSGNYTFDVRTNAVSQAVITLGSSATKFAFRVENNNIGASAGGSSVTTDTSATIGLMNTMQIGNAYWATQANGTISRVSIYSEPLTDTNLTALSS